MAHYAERWTETPSKIVCAARFCEAQGPKIFQQNQTSMNVSADVGGASGSFQVREDDQVTVVNASAVSSALMTDIWAQSSVV
jgi:hypothetical protein